MANGNEPTRVPHVELVPRSAGGLAGALFNMTDDLMAGKEIDHRAVGSLTKMVGAYCSLVRTHLQVEKAAVAMRRDVGLVVNGKADVAPDGEAPTGN